MAALLGVSPGVPNTSYNSLTGTTYNSGSGLLQVTAPPLLMQMVSGGTRDFIVSPKSLTIAIQVNSAGALVGGTAGDDLVLTGTVAGYSGVLLTGEIVEFGIQKASSTLDYLDFRFRVTGGSMAPLFEGKDIGVTQAMEGSTFTGTFTQSFSGGAKGNLGPIPMKAVCAGVIGDFIWQDTDRDGIQDAGETGLDNVTIRLKDGSGAVIATKVSGPNGAYLFEGLCAGNYSVWVDTATLPPDFIPSPTLQGGDAGRDSNQNGASVNLPTGTSIERTVDFGYNSSCAGAIGDLVWHDQDRDGMQDPGEPGLAGVAVKLFSSASTLPIAATTTDGSGHYRFTGLCADNYRIEVVAPEGFVPSAVLQGGDPAADSNPNPFEVSLSSDTAVENTVDFALNTPCSGSIGDLIWHDLDRDGLQDSGEPGIQGVRLTLKDSFSNPIASATTNENGAYFFGGLCAGTYRVEVEGSSLPPGFVPSPSAAGDNRTLDSNGAPAAVVLGTDFSSDPTVDFGFNSPCTGAIGDFVWMDADRDGRQGAGEAGINGVVLTLKDVLNTVIATTTSGKGPLGQDGYYAFQGLCAGRYAVEVSAPTGLQPSPGEQGGDSTTDSNGTPAPFFLATDDTVDPTVDFGFNSPCGGQLGDRVWDDLNRNGIQDGGEPGLDGVTVNLRSAANALLASTMSANGGLFSFSGLCAGDYLVEVLPPAGRTLSPSGEGGNELLDSNPNPYPATLPTDMSSDLSIDFGFNTPCRGSIGDFVWHDTDRNGLQDAGEPGIGGAAVTLKDSLGTVIGTTNTTSAGFYLFTGLCRGDYTVEITTPAGFVPSPALQGNDRALDSNTNSAPVSLLSDADSNTTIDFGFNTPCTGTLGDLVWNDLDGNGLQGTKEPGIEGVTVNLRDANHTLLRTTSTDAAGGYRFIGLCSGDYKVEVVPPAGMFLTTVETGADRGIDSNLNPSQVTLFSDTGTDATLDFGFYVPYAVVGDLVWNDLNRNGIQDAGEPGVAGVAVKIYSCGAATPLFTTTTNASGIYLFSELPAGSYSVEFVLPSGYAFAPRDQGGNEAMDSDADPSTGSTVCMTVAAGENDLSWDAGISPSAAGCTYTQGFWKNHPEEWPATSLKLGSISYTKNQLLSILKSPVKENGLIALSYQLIAAKLNLISGASVPQGVRNAISAADAMIGGLIVPPVGRGYLNTAATASLADTLDQFNNGFADGGPTHCQDLPPTTGSGSSPFQGSGCSPGYWKTHGNNWPAGSRTTVVFNDLFGVNAFQKGITLLQALSQGGGALSKLARHGTAAYLNALDARVSGFPMTVSEVRAAVSLALQTGNYEPLGTQLDTYNNLGCPLN